VNKKIWGGGGGICNNCLLEMDFKVTGNSIKEIKGAFCEKP
jgi:hypothetical protein